LEIIDWFDKHIGLAQWGAALGAFAVVLAALFGGRLTKHLNRPVLEPVFDQGNGDYVRATQITGEDIDYPFAPPGKTKDYSAYNCLFKVENSGKSTAENVVCRVERIIFHVDSQELIKNPQIFHPTVLHWSGTDNHSPINIYQNSFHFLDFIYVCFDQDQLIQTYERTTGKPWPEKKTTNNEHWNLWVNAAPGKGLEKYFKYEGGFEVHFHIAGDNMAAAKYIAYVEWSKEKLIPNIKVNKDTSFKQSWFWPS